MRRKWDADVVRNLTKRGHTYYYRTDFKDSNGKRHAFRRSLHTSDFCTAVRLITQLKAGDVMNGIYGAVEEIMRLRKPKDTLIKLLEEILEEQRRQRGAGACTSLGMGWGKRDENPDGRDNILKKILRESTTTKKKLKIKPIDVESIFSPIGVLRIRPPKSAHVTVQPTVAPTAVQTEQPKKQRHGMTIDEMANAFIAWKNVESVEQKREHTWITNFAKSAGVKMKDDFSTICSPEAVSKIVEGIKKTTNQNTWKRKNISLLDNLFDYAENRAKVRYQVDGRGSIQKMPKQRHKEGKGHQPFTTVELKKLFSQKNTYFDKNPDYFWAFLIALYTGARKNAAGTLQFKDVRLEYDIPCIEYIDDHPAKQLKTLDTERVVPIAQQLLELGFFDMIAERKKRLQATDTDFILHGCMSVTDKLSSHFSEKVAEMLTAAGIKSTKKDEKGKLIHDGKSFHSCRNTISIKLDDARIKESVVNKIIGWSGGSTRQKHYLKRELTEIAEALKLCKYDEIMPELRYWATRLRKKESKLTA